MRAITKIKESSIDKLINTKRVLKQNYSAMAGKSANSREETKMLSSKAKRFLIDNHVQLFHDFNIIYEEKKDIHIYQIGTLITKPYKDLKTINLSKKENYLFEKKPQELNFMSASSQIKSNFYIFRNSKKYFEDEKIKKEIENQTEYKEMFDNVIKELQERKIKFRMARSKDEEDLSGLNVIIKENAGNTEIDTSR